MTDHPTWRDHFDADQLPLVTDVADVEPRRSSMIACLDLNGKGRCGRPAGHAGDHQVVGRGGPDPDKRWPRVEYQKEQP
jgi:hypothetical protein